MTRLKKLTIAMTVAVGSLTVVPTASALPASQSQCYTHATLRNAYEVTGWAFLSIDNYAAADYWFAMADFQDALVVGVCGFGI
jgi:hypothetical protein